MIFWCNQALTEHLFFGKSQLVWEKEFNIVIEKLSSPDITPDRVVCILQTSASPYYYFFPGASTFKLAIFGESGFGGRAEHQRHWWQLQL